MSSLTNFLLGNFSRHGMEALMLGSPPPSPEKLSSTEDLRSMSEPKQTEETTIEYLGNMIDLKQEKKTTTIYFRAQQADATYKKVISHTISRTFAWDEQQRQVFPSGPSQIAFLKWKEMQKIANSSPDNKRPFIVPFPVTRKKLLIAFTSEETLETQNAKDLENHLSLVALDTNDWSPSPSIYKVSLMNQNQNSPISAYVLKFIAEIR